jgi:C-lobe and N-lobe beta barrels of Tf-binding protein B
MRIAALLIGTSLLSACGGGGTGGTQSAGNLPPVTTPTPGTTGADHTFVNPTEVKTYTAIGAAHSYRYQVKVDNLAGTSTGQGLQLYQGDATTVRDGAISVEYNPRDAIFNISYQDTKAGVSTTDRFQDPAHRTNFGGALEPQLGTPQLAAAGIQYLQHAGSSGSTGGSDIPLDPTYIFGVLPPKKTSGVYDQTTFFYQKPGTTTKYVTFAGFLRNIDAVKLVDSAAVAAQNGQPASPATSITTHDYQLSRGLFVYGENSTALPKTGTASFSGTMLASMIFNDQLDTNPGQGSYFQMIEGTANTKVDFGANTFSLDVTGTTFAPQFDYVGFNGYTIAGGASFAAAGKGQIDFVKAGGFLGQFQTASFVNPNGTRYDLNIAGSSIDGAFYGPNATEVGGSYRIVGGTPDERIDILGVFVGK